MSQNASGGSRAERISRLEDFGRIGTIELEVASGTIRACARAMSLLGTRELAALEELMARVPAGDRLVLEAWRDSGTPFARQMRLASGDARARQLDLAGFDEGEARVLLMRELPATLSEHRPDDAEDLFALAFFEAPVGASIVRLTDRRVLGINKAFTEITGWRGDEVLDRSMDDFQVFADPERVGPIFMRLILGGELEPFETTILDRSGKAYDVQVAARAVEIRGERCLITFFRDLTPFKHAQQRLIHSEDRFSHMFHATPLAAAIYNIPRGRIVEANRAFASLVGTVLEGMAKKRRRLSDYLASEADYKRVRRSLSERGVVQDLEIGVRTANGAVKPVLLTARAMLMGDEQHMLFYLTDITERKRIEAQLHQAQKMEAIGQLAGGIAHDFNNMLSGIAGFAELIRIDPTAEQALEYVDRIIDTTARAAELTRQLLMFGRRQSVGGQRVALGEIVDGAVQILGHSLDPRIEIVLDLEDPGLALLGDPSQLESALLNICINARDAMPAGGVLTVSARPTTRDAAWCANSAFDVAPGRYLELAVRDTGTGIAPDLLDNIFEPFFTTKDPGHGTGLGLAAVYGTMRSHEGAIEVETAENAGSCFRMYLPLAGDPSLERQPERRGVPIEGSGRILVVDDESLLRDLVADSLTRLGYDVTTARDGMDALEIFDADTEGFDLVFLDMIMPKLNGHDTFQRLKAIDENVRVLITSGYADGDALEATLAAGAVDVVRKPYDLATLSRRISRALAGR